MAAGFHVPLVCRNGFAWLEESPAALPRQLCIEKLFDLRAQAPRSALPAAPLSGLVLTDWLATPAPAAPRLKGHGCARACPQGQPSGKGRARMELVSDLALPKDQVLITGPGRNHLDGSLVGPGVARPAKGLPVNGDAPRKGFMHAGDPGSEAAWARRHSQPSTQNAPPDHGLACRP